jgi:hypothetical protein
VTTPAKGVRTPDFDFKAERENDPVAGYAWNKVPSVFVTPMAMSSWLGLILYPLTRPNAASIVSKRYDGQIISGLHLAMAMCSRRRIMVATGMCGARALTSSLPMTGGPTFWNPAGTVCKILIGYLPEAVLWSRQYSQAAMVNTITTKAFLVTEMKKKSRAGRDTIRVSS